jgi:PAS domain S-box-containing protein
MKRYVRFDDDDAKALAVFGKYAASRFRAIAAEFYERTRAHEEAHAVFRDESQIEQLQRSLVRWMHRICEGPHDEAYFRESAKIGRVHVKIGLPQRYMFTAMALIRESFEAIAAELPQDQWPMVRRALARVLDLELAIMLETYRDDFVSRASRLERVALERALERSEQRQANVFEVAHVLAVGIDRDGRIALFNQEAGRVTGWARDEALGENFVDLLFASELRDAARARVTRARSGECRDEVWESEITTRAGKHRIVTWQLAYAPHEDDEDDKDVLLYAIGTDVTEQRARDELSIRSQKLAAVGTLAAGLAHEIRNPLNGALLHVTFLERALRKQTDKNKDAMEAIALVGDEIRRLSALVNDFLVFARPAPAKLRPTGLRAIGVRVAELAAADAETGRVVLRTDWGGSDPMLPLDAPKIEQALLNLVRNAIDATSSQGGGTVTLRIRRKPRHVIVEVEDDGPGLPGADAPIFDPFYSTKPQGTGLGLAIVHRVVTDHHGTVAVQSVKGHTVFTISLPLEEPSGDSFPQEPRPEEAE